MIDELTSMVIAAVRETAADDQAIAGADLRADTVLFGSEGLLDSIGLVSVVVAVEQAIDDKYGVRVGLADEKALSQKHSPYRTIGSLATYAAGEIAAKRGHGG